MATQWLRLRSAPVVHAIRSTDARGPMAWCGIGWWNESSDWSVPPVALPQCARCRRALARDGAA